MTKTRDGLLDVRDIIARVEELEDDRAGYDEGADGPEATFAERVTPWSEAYPDECAELASLEALLQEVRGYGGDEQWRGDWYPLTFIRDSYFRDYAQELAEDCGDIDFAKLSWPLTCIDWDQAARELRTDYSSIEFGGVTYWYR